MKSISVRELHLRTGWWVRHAASGGAVVITDRGRGVAALHPLGPIRLSRPLPEREAAIRRRSRIPVDAVLMASTRDRDRIMQLLENPPQPTAALRAAARRRRTKL